jgi:hypothetical protein
MRIDFFSCQAQGSGEKAKALRRVQCTTCYLPGLLQANLAVSRRKPTTPMAASGAVQRLAVVACCEILSPPWHRSRDTR